MLALRYYEHVNGYNSQVAETVKRTRNNLGEWPHGSRERRLHRANYHSSVVRCNSTAVPSESRTTAMWHMGVEIGDQLLPISLLHVHRDP